MHLYIKKCLREMSVQEMEIHIDRILEESVLVIAKGLICHYAMFLVTSTIPPGSSIA